MAGPDILERLGAVIEQRRHERPAGSYVVQLLDGGLEAIAAKLREESEELIEAAAAGDAAHTAHEAADLLFHAWVLLAQAGVEASAVYAELERRFGTGGLAEKASRTAGAQDPKAAKAAKSAKSAKAAESAKAAKAAKSGQGEAC